MRRRVQSVQRTRRADTLPPWAELPALRPRFGTVLAVPALLPRPVALRARREVYSYPFPSQKRRARRAIRLSLRVHGRHPYVHTMVRIRLPRTLPLVSSSYVSFTPTRLNIHSARQLRNVVDRRELNRYRYLEKKSHRRRARYGQLDSPGADAFGSVAASAARGLSVQRVADAALVARAILKGGM